MRSFRTIPTIAISFLLFSCSNVDKTFFCSKESNILRKRFSLPAIDSNMTLDESAFASDSRWQSPVKYPSDTIPLHAWKTITVGRSFITSESDAFRKRIDDTLFYQLNIYSKVLNDSSVTITGLVFYVMENESRSTSFDFDKKYMKLDNLGVDSVKKAWKISF
jgi:hypothetical protein